MDRPDRTSGSTAAPRAPSDDSDGVRLPPRPIAAFELGAALARSLAAANASSSSAVVTSGDYAPVLETARRHDHRARSQPPLPLPPRAFFTAPESVSESPPTASPADDPLFSFDLPPPKSELEPETEFEPQPEPEPKPEQPEPLEPAITSPAPEAPPEGDVFSEIEAEVSSRAETAEEPAKTGPFAEASVVQTDTPELALFDTSVPAREPFGQAIPQRMLEPQLWAPPPPPAFDGLTVDPSMRPDLAPAPKKRTKERVSKPKSSLLKRIFKIAAWLVVGWLALVLMLIVLYRFVDPPASALMLQHWLTGRPVSQNWVRIEDVSPNVVRAVLLSEDGRFCQHSGIDFEALEDAVEKAGGGNGTVRGASTISMQVVKNMFLWPSKSYLRKAIELPLTYVMELVWPKQRILEVYLNIAEWGPGIFGIGEAAEYYFHKPAKNLTERESARLAVALPNPLTRNAGKPGPGLQRLANAIQVRMRLAPSSQLACVLPKRRI